MSEHIDEQDQKIVPVPEGAIDEPQTKELSPDRPPALLRRYKKKRSALLGHLRSFIGVNGGLAAINLITGLTADTLYPWFLYVTASWGIGLVIHGLNYRGWLKDHEPELRRARVTVEQIDDDPPELSSPTTSKLAQGKAPPALPPGDRAWDELIEECFGAVDAAREALDGAEMDDAERVILSDKLDRGLEVVEEIRRGAFAVGTALVDVAPDGGAALDKELTQLEEKIEATKDERLKGVYEANRRLLEARQDKVKTLEAEQERMRATVNGFLIATQNVRLDAARLGTGQVPELLGSLSDSLDRLNDEVEVARQVESELEKI
jgi:hypothetical protein